ncbi:MarR family winged helix-turn-helix transcriptional regulator [Leptospira sp. 96542]|nr:MarR family winged helix-turn-helix transcriptional regulator [Leptospira sp. 96542]
MIENTVNNNNFTQNKKNYRQPKVSESSNFDFGMIFSRFYKYFKIHSKNILFSFGMQTLEEFALLGHLDSREHSNKNTIISELSLDQNSMNQLLNRMLDSDLITNAKNGKKKLETMFSITPNGRRVLAELQNEFNQLPNLLMQMATIENKIHSNVSRM